MKKDLNKFFIHPKATIKAAMKQMDRGAERMLLVTDKKRHLIGVLTDGDIRRYILREGTIVGTIDLCYNKSPTYVEEPITHDKIHEEMLSHKLMFLPIVDKKHKIIDIIFWNEMFKDGVHPFSYLSIPAIIMAGGKGTRLDPFTRILPKPLLPINDKTVVEVIMDKLNKFGINEFFLTLNYKGHMIKTYLDNFNTNYKIHYLLEPDYLGTAGSLSMLPESFSESFLVTNCDIILEIDFSEVEAFHKKSGNEITIIGSVQHIKVPYGVIEFSENGSLTKMSEKPEYDIFINTGVYIINSDLFQYIPKNSYFDMPDLIQRALENKRKISVFPISEKAYIDIGQWKEYKKNIKTLMD